MDDAVSRLIELLRKAGARPTLDRQRDQTLPCMRCRTTTEPRTLVTVGYWCRDSYGGMLAGDPIVRPLCVACEKATAPSVRTPTWPNSAKPSVVVEGEITTLFQWATGRDWRGKRRAQITTAEQLVDALSVEQLPLVPTDLFKAVLKFRKLRRDVRLSKARKFLGKHP